MYADNRAFEAKPSKDCTFKYWAYGEGFDKDIQGQPVTGDFIETYLASDYTEAKTFVAVFTNSKDWPKAVFTPAKGTSVANMTFYYDEFDHNDDPGATVYNVLQNTSDVKLPSWYRTTEGWHTNDSHGAVYFDEAIENGGRNGIKVG